MESCRSLDVTRLNKEGWLQPGTWVSWEWRADGEQVASIGLSAEADQLILNYRVCRNGEDWTDVEEAVPLARSPCRFGGMRTYFVCPGVKNGRPCLRRVSKLYHGGDTFSAATATIWRTPVRANPAPPGFSAVPTSARSLWAEFRDLSSAEAERHALAHLCAAPGRIVSAERHKASWHM